MKSGKVPAKTNCK